MADGSYATGLFREWSKNDSALKDDLILGVVYSQKNSGVDCKVYDL